MAKELNRGWVTHDEGALAQSAERVLQGDIPITISTRFIRAGLSYLNALGFHVFGTQLSSLRYVLYLFFLAWVPSVYYVASRLYPPPLRSCHTARRGLGVPNYAAAMPSWYNLFFASFGVGSVCATSRLGASGGCSLRASAVVCLFCSRSAAFFIAGILLFLLFSGEPAADERPIGRSMRNAYRTLLVVSVFIVQLRSFGVHPKGTRPSFVLLLHSSGTRPLRHIIWHEFALGNRKNQRVTVLLRKLAVFGGGVAVPVMAFLAPYVAGGHCFTIFCMGVFVLPAKRFAFASFIQVPLWFVCGVAADLAILAAIFATGPRATETHWKSCFGECAHIAGLHAHESSFLQRIWTATWTLLPVLWCWGSWF